MNDLMFIRVVKIAFGVGLLVLVLLMGYVCHYLYQDNKKMMETNAALTEKVSSLKHDLQLIEIGQTAMGLGQLLADEKKESLSKKSREVRDTIKQKETEIDKTITDPAERAKAKSIVRMNGVWDMYCQIQPDNAICKSKGEKP